MKDKEHYMEEYINYLYGDIPFKDRALYQPEITQSIADFQSGFNLAEELFKPKWISVETPPDFNKQVLIKFIRANKSEVITQGYYQDVAQETADNCLRTAQKFNKFSDNGVEKVEFWRKCGYGLTWFDYAGRQIQSLTAKGSKNKVVAWMKILQ